MIKFGTQWQLNPRTGQVERARTQAKSADQIFREVKARRHDLIRAHNITDDELKAIITKVMSGTRNVLYLAKGADMRRLRDISAYIVREYS